MAIGEERHADVSKQITLFTDVAVASTHARHVDHMTGKCFSSRNELQQEC